MNPKIYHVYVSGTLEVRAANEINAKAIALDELLASDKETIKDVLTIEVQEYKETNKEDL